MVGLNAGIERRADRRKSTQAATPLITRVSIDLTNHAAQQIEPLRASR
jgi:hypothetical protein